MKNKFDLIIFDWDGTLIDSIDWIVHCLQTAGKQCGCDIPEPQAAKDVIGLSIRKACAKLFPGADDETLTQLTDCYQQTYLSRQLSREDLFPGVYEMLVELKQAGYQLAVATGKTRTGLQEALQATDTEDLFCITRCSDEAASKPDPLMLHQIMQHANAANERSLMVGDSTHDLQMAMNAQISSIAVSCGAHPQDILQQYSPLICLQQPAELLNIIRG
ncbi:HAD-IIIA family hydrolase [Methylobacter sp. Wu8]|uniref:Phosphoglycolate phosphatase n=1 Tax=Methylobacter tundripaludum TaxID=173365 RepID=A0A2S6GHR4_9GAMM|nr:HAD-IIIA family hydrolase [Methylobacter tundripaludum]MCF7966024.1 HAD-IIIA family hydrolase [Methylobacter tundripaludum]MCK9638121.1 HAD-IIIA family hydrolase [Methylobacter tundripaludum]PPK64757.1 phosphoglycolate phosphatase [Methylobacter tundripaludum]